MDYALEQMYQEVILQEAKSPYGRVDRLPDATEPAAAVATADASVAALHESCSLGSSHQFNPTCGDEATVQVTLDTTGERLLRVCWQGQGCSISQASLSIMTQMVQGRTVDEALQLFAHFRTLMASRGEGVLSDDGAVDESAQEDLGDAMVFQGVARYPMRIKCALLGWEGLRSAIAQALAQNRA